MVTAPLTHMASRVAASLCCAVGCPQMVRSPRRARRPLPRPRGLTAPLRRAGHAPPCALPSTSCGVPTPALTPPPLADPRPSRAATRASRRARRPKQQRRPTKTKTIQTTATPSHFKKNDGRWRATSPTTRRRPSGGAPTRRPTPRCAPSSGATGCTRRSSTRGCGSRSGTRCSSR